MDPWSFGSEGKGLLFPDEIDYPFDAFARPRKASMEWEPKPSYSFENDELITVESAESIEFTEFGFTDVMGEHFHGCEVASPTRMITPNSSFGEVEKLCGSVMECNSNDSSLIDLKLGRLGNCIVAEDLSKDRSMLPYGDSSMMAKRARTTTTTTTTTTSSYYSRPFCQVQGCNMDLSSSKEYHKRHKVCEAHSKTSRVIVNGIEKRFCQQCSRFHLLAEFDDGKRSCRKRLAGHNERRRKPQLDSVYGKSHIFLQPIQGVRFQCSHIKFDKAPLCSPQLEVPMMNGALLSNSFPRLHNIGKEHGSVTPLDAPTYDQELSDSLNSSCVLSLLSTQSHDFSRFSSGLISGKALHSSVLNPIDIDHSGSIMLPKTGHDVDGKGIFVSSGFSDSKQRLSAQGTTVDLLQLSSHLQRVEQQRSFVQIKQENEDYFGFLST